MSWSLNVSGHIEGDIETAKPLEQPVIAAAREFAAKTGGTGTLVTQHNGTITLKPTEETE